MQWWVTVQNHLASSQCSTHPLSYTSTLLFYFIKITRQFHLIKKLPVIKNEDFANNCNNPSLVIPGGFARVGGVPFGMQIEGPTGSDRRVIAVARAIEKALQLWDNNWEKFHFTRGVVPWGFCQSGIGFVICVIFFCYFGVCLMCYFRL